MTFRNAIVAAGVLAANLIPLAINIPAARSGWCWKVEDGVIIVNKPDDNITMAKFVPQQPCCNTEWETIMHCRLSAQCSNSSGTMDDDYPTLNNLTTRAMDCAEQPTSTEESTSTEEPASTTVAAASGASALSSAGTLMMATVGALVMS
mmetsp:Transcript_48250/g.105033  ORF Transcript_48250/g.105033 Transcript_48250/m.105033 type:complete len:149 (+) Transcript_48250:96-542(+)